MRGCRETDPDRAESVQTAPSVKYWRYRLSSSTIGREFGGAKCEWADDGCSAVEWARIAVAGAPPLRELVFVLAAVVGDCDWLPRGDLPDGLGRDFIAEFRDGRIEGHRAQVAFEAV